MTQSPLLARCAQVLAEPFVSHMPAARESLPEGDLRDWPEIEAWAAGIARDLQGVPPG